MDASSRPERPPVTLERVRQALSAHTPKSASPALFHAINAPETQARRAGVLCALVDGESGLEMVLTRRVEHLRVHAGQVSFPGGRVDPADADERAAALREAYEEIGLPPSHVEVIGHLDEMPTITGFYVTPVVGYVHTPVTLVPSPDEVASIFQVPVDWLFDDSNVQLSERELLGKPLQMHRFDWGEEMIWGATARMIVDLKHLVLGL